MEKLNRERVEALLVLLGTGLLYGMTRLRPSSRLWMIGVVVGSVCIIVGFLMQEEDRKRERERRAVREFAAVFIRNAQGRCLDCLLREWGIREGIFAPGSAAPSHSCSESHRERESGNATGGDA